MAQVYRTAARVECCRRHAGGPVPPLCGETEVRPSGEHCEVEPFHTAVDAFH
jgi:hypothetical protein